MSAVDDSLLGKKFKSGGNVLDCLGVPQGFYYLGQPTGALGTSSLASCCAVVGVNPDTKTVFFAHVDAGKSTTQTQDLLNKIDPARIEIYRGSSKSKPIGTFIQGLEEVFGDRLVVTDLDVPALVLAYDSFDCVPCDDINPSNADDYKRTLFLQALKNQTDQLLPMP